MTLLPIIPFLNDIVVLIRLLSASSSTLRACRRPTDEALLCCGAGWPRGSPPGGGEPGRRGAWGPRGSQPAGGCAQYHMCSHQHGSAVAARRHSLELSHRKWLARNRPPPSMCASCVRRHAVSARARACAKGIAADCFARLSYTAWMASPHLLMPRRAGWRLCPQAPRRR